MSSSVAKVLMGKADNIQRQCVASIIRIAKGLIEATRHLSRRTFLQLVEYQAQNPRMDRANMFAGGHLDCRQRRNGCAFVAFGSLSAGRAKRGRALRRHCKTRGYQRVHHQAPAARKEIEVVARDKATVGPAF